MFIIKLNNLPHRDEKNNVLIILPPSHLSTLVRVPCYGSACIARYTQLHCVYRARSCVMLARDCVCCVAWGVKSGPVYISESCKSCICHYLKCNFRCNKSCICMVKDHEMTKRIMEYDVILITYPITCTGSYVDLQQTLQNQDNVRV